LVQRFEEHSLPLVKAQAAASLLVAVTVTAYLRRQKTPEKNSRL